MTVTLPPENVFGHRKKLEFLRKEISDYVSSHPDRDVRLLDVGCSNGQYITIHLGDLGVKILAIDPHGPSIEFGIENNPHPDAIEFRALKIENIPGDENYDIIVMADILEHLEDPESLLREAKKRLTDGGVILASIPNGYGPFEIENALDKRGCLLPSYWLFNLLSGLKGLLTGRKTENGADTEAVPYAHECGHVQFWTLGSFRKLVKNCGLKITDWSKGPWFGALCTSTWWGRSGGFCRWNAKAGDSLPSWMVSVWYFRIEK